MGPRAGLEGRKISSPLGFDPGPSKILADNLCKILHDNMDDSYIKPKCVRLSWCMCTVCVQ